MGSTGGAALDRGAGLLACRAQPHDAPPCRSRTARRGRTELMITFVLLAAALTLASVVAVAIPLLRQRAAGAPAAPWAALATASVLVVGSAALYVTWSKWSWRAAPAADTPESMV